MTDKKPHIKEEQATVYLVRGIPQGGWADVTIRPWEVREHRGGSLDIQSDFGTFSHQWGSIGDRTFIQFLCGLDMDYFSKKTRPQDYRLFSLPKTCDAIRKRICSDRREHCISKEQARDHWEEVNDVEGEATDHNADSFYNRFIDTDALEGLYAGDMCSIDTRTEYNPMCEMFWERVWLPLVEYWKENCDGG